MWKIYASATGKREDEILVATLQKCGLDFVTSVGELIEEAGVYYRIEKIR
jgi:transcription elongation factor Elf1